MIRSVRVTSSLSFSCGAIASLAVALLFLPASHILAQTPREPVQVVRTDSSNVVRLGFERLLNTLTGTGEAFVRGGIGDVRYEIEQHVRSRRVRVPGAPKQDEYKGDVRLIAPVSGPISLRLTEASSVLGGSRGAGIEAIAQHRFLLGPEYRPTPWLSLTGLGGWEWNRQQDRTDDGHALTGSVDIDGVDFEGLSLVGTASWLSSDLGARRPEDIHARARLLSSFQPGSGDSLDITYSRQVRELYSGTGVDPVPGTATLLRRSEEVLSVRNALWFMTSGDLAGAIEGGLLQRGIDRSFRGTVDVPGVSYPLPTTIDQLMIDVLGRVHWSPAEAFTTKFSAGFVTGEETHDARGDEDVSIFEVDAQRAQARRRSNTYERFHTTVALVTSPMEDAIAALEGSASILRYDTPDTLNTDDRDEQRVSAGLHLVYNITPGLAASVRIEAGQSHLVYLSRFQSANNVRIRTLRFAPGVVWAERGHFRNAMHAEVAASYTVYDYEDLISSVQSFSYRQAAWTDSLTVSLSTRMELEFFGSLRLFERGILRWSDFKERPQRAFLEIFLWPRISYRVLDRIIVGVGFRSFRQEQYQYEQNTRTYDGAVGSFGPTVSVTAVVGGAARVAMTGWRETQHVNGTHLRSLSNLSLSVETHL